MATNRKINLRYSTNKNKLVVALIAVAVLAIAAYTNYTHEENHRVVVISTQMMQSVSSDKDGKVSTSYNFLVTTNNGIFDVDQEGVYSHPELLGIIHQGDTINIKTKGFSIPFLGARRKIVSVWK